LEQKNLSNFLPF